MFTQYIADVFIRVKRFLLIKIYFHMRTILLFKQEAVENVLSSIDGFIKFRMSFEASPHFE